MRNKLILILLLICILLGVAVYVLIKRVQAVAEQRDDYALVAKAYAGVSDKEREDAVVFRLRADELAASKDSLLQRMDSLRRALGVRDRRLRAMHFRSTVVEKTDTFWVAVPDTVYALAIDTVLDDGWVRTSLLVEEDGRVTLGTRVRNETTIVVKAERETVRPPRRFFLFRLFQRKQTVVRVVATEGNPWCETKEVRSVEIVK